MPRSSRRGARLDTVHVDEGRVVAWYAAATSSAREHGASSARGMRAHVGVVWSSEAGRGALVAVAPSPWGSVRRLPSSPDADLSSEGFQVGEAVVRRFKATLDFEPGVAVGDQAA